MNRLHIIRAIVGVTVIGLMAVSSEAADSEYRWIGANGDYAVAANWLSDFNTNAVPPGNDTPWINNGGVANADGATSGSGGVLDQFAFHVGVADSFRTADDGELGVGTLNLTNLDMDANTAPGFRVGYNRGEARSVNGTVSVVNGNIILSDSGGSELQVGVAVGDLGGHTATGKFTASGYAAAHNTSTLVFRVGQYAGSGGGSSGHAEGTAEIGTGMDLWGEVNVGVYSNPGGSGSATGKLTVHAGGLSCSNTDSATINVGTAVGANSTTVGSADLTGSLRPNPSEGLLWAVLNVGVAEGYATTGVTADATFRSSHVQVGAVNVGIRTNGTETVTAELALNPSLIDTDMLTVGDAGTLTFHLEGLTRVTGGTVGNAGTYAAADAADALLDGVIVADFDFTPTAGTHTFDLIVTDSLTALDDTTMLPSDFQVVGLHPGFAVDAFGLVDDGTDTIRLQISGVPEPATLSLMALGGLALLRRKRVG